MCVFMEIGNAKLSGTRKIKGLLNRQLQSFSSSLYTNLMCSLPLARNNPQFNFVGSFISV